MTLSTSARLAPLARPSGAAAGYQRWRELLFLHWRVDPAALQALLPRGLTLDLYQPAGEEGAGEGEALVGVVPFKMEGVRPRWAPEALAFEFLETNLRAYVHRDGEPGVYFFSLEAASRVAVWTARAGWGLPYFYARMRSRRAQDGWVSYSSARGAEEDLEVRYRPGEPLAPSAPGSLEFYLLERYLLFTERGGALWRGQVHHAPYPARAVEVGGVSERLLAHAGLAPLGDLRCAHYSEGVDVEVFALERC